MANAIFDINIFDPNIFDCGSKDLLKYGTWKRYNRGWKYGQSTSEVNAAEYGIFTRATSSGDATVKTPDSSAAAPTFTPDSTTPTTYTKD